MNSKYDRYVQRHFSKEDTVKIGYSKCEVCGLAKTGWWRKCPEHGPMKNTSIMVALAEILSIADVNKKQEALKLKVGDLTRRVADLERGEPVFGPIPHDEPHFFGPLPEKVRDHLRKIAEESSK